MKLEEKIENLGRLLDELGISEIFIKEKDDYIKIVKKEKEIPEEKKEPCVYKEIIAPLSGRFYRSQKPGDSPYVETGGMIEPGKTICLIEAMKVFNEIKAEIKGKIVNILATDGHLVKAGDILFLVEPSL
ncbi:MAG: biotin/lipoyl-containing protein [bacterium]